MSDPARAALQGLVNHIEDMQELMRRYIPPDSGIAAEAFIADIIERLDGPVARVRMAAARKALGETP